MSLDDLQAQLRGALDQQFAALKSHYEQAIVDVRRQATADADRETAARLEKARAEWESALASILEATRAETRQQADEAARAQRNALEHQLQQQLEQTVQHSVNSVRKASELEIEGLRRRVEEDVQAERRRGEAALQAAVDEERGRLQQAAGEQQQRAQQELDAERQRAKQELDAERQRAQQELEAAGGSAKQALDAERQRAQQELDAERQRAQQLEAASGRAQQELDAERQRAQQELDAERQRAQQLEAAGGRAEQELNAERQRVQRELEDERARAKTELETVQQLLEADIASAQAEAVSAREEAAAATARATEAALTAEAAQIAAAAAAAQPAPAPVATGSAALARLPEALRAMDAARSLSQTLEALLQHAGGIAGRAALFLINADRLKVWKTVEIPEIDVQTVESSINGRDLLASAIQSGRTVAASADLPAPPFARLQKDRPAVAVPFMIAGRAVAVLYADAGAAEPAAGWAEGVELVTRHASTIAALHAATRTLEVLRGDTPDAALADGAGNGEESARRYARLLVSEIKLYNEGAVRAGRQQRDLRHRLREEIDRALRLYEERVPPAVGAREQYFHQELVQTLADGDPSLLGS